MWNGINKRKFPRCDLALELNISFGKKIKYIATRTENLGIGGVCLLLDMPLEPFNEISLKMPLDDEQVPIECNGRVMWIVQRHKKHPKNSTYDVGIEFVNISREDKDRIVRFLTKKKGYC